MPVMTSCACGGVPTHGDVCCWCWVVELTRPLAEGHTECMLAARRLGPIKTRFRSAQQAVLDGCLAVIHSSDAVPIRSMSVDVAEAARRHPDRIVSMILAKLVSGLTAEIRSRVKVS